MSQSCSNTQEEIITSSEAEALSEIVTWSTNKPNWMKDALRRLYINGKLDDNDIDELFNISKNDSHKFIPFTIDDIRDPNVVSTSVILTSVKNVMNVNALAENQELPFSPQGMTIIYGNNGAGKSGYVKILKAACRARGTKEDNEILQNIYSTTTGEQKAQINFYSGSIPVATEWIKGKSTDARLSAISVFDSRAAAVHIASRNSVAYTPYPLKILSDLAKAAQQLRLLFDKEIKELEAQTPLIIKNPKLHSATKVSTYFKQITHKSTKDEIESFITFTPEEIQRYEALNADLSGDTGFVAKQLAAKRSQIEDIIHRLNTLIDAVSLENFTELQKLRDAYLAAAQAAQAASSSLFSKEPLPDVGSETWRILWEAARAYSQTSAYPQQEFPVTTSEARCPLCQQLLDEQAALRFISFETFVKDESKANEAAALKAYVDKKNEILSSWLNSTDRNLVFNIARTAFDDEPTLNILRKDFLTLLLQVRGITRGIAPYVHSSSTKSLEILQEYLQKIIEREKAIKEEQNSPQFKALIAEYNELQDRIWLQSIQEEIYVHIERQKKIYSLKEMQKKTDFTSITNQSKKVAKLLITDMLRARFTKELEKLGVVNLAIEMQQDKGTEGIPYFRIVLSRKPDKDVAKILSEGEHRCVALAAFLSELCTVDTKSAIVFDDPVSSLDHMYTGKVVERLTEEAKERQVIIFTHDLPFMLSLKESCKKSNVKSSFATITRTEDYTGLCLAQEPFRAKSALSLVAALREKLSKSKQLFETGNDAWQFEASTIIKWLRIAWENAVEEVIYPVLRRYDKDVYTSNLFKLTILTEEDCIEMREWYDKCSPDAHARPIPINSPPLSPNEVEGLLLGLENWLAKIQEKQKNLDRQRNIAKQSTTISA